MINRTVDFPWFNLSDFRPFCIWYHHWWMRWCFNLVHLIIFPIKCLNFLVEEKSDSNKNWLVVLWSSYMIQIHDFPETMGGSHGFQDTLRLTPEAQNRWKFGDRTLGSRNLVTSQGSSFEGRRCLFPLSLMTVTTGLIFFFGRSTFPFRILRF
jgi:hypothetical protein